VLDAVGGRALKYYSAQDAKKLNPDALGRRARALLLVGEMQNMRGDLDGALAAYKDAARTTEEQLNRDPENPQRLFDHSQSVFWVGYIALQTGKADVAESNFRQYQKYAAKLVAKDPKKPEWQQELAYAHSNLGVVKIGRGDWKAALADFDKTLAIFGDLSKRSPDDSQLQMEVSNAMAWRADSFAIGGDVSGAIAQRQAQSKLLDGLLRREPQNAVASFDLVVATRDLGMLANLSGDAPLALRSLSVALQAASTQRQSDLQNVEYKINEIKSRREIVAVYLKQCNTADAMLQIKAALPLLQSIPNPDKGLRQQKEQIDLELQTFTYRAQLLTAPTGVSPTAMRAMIEQRAASMAGMTPGRDDNLLFARAEIVLGDSYVIKGDGQRAVAAWKAAQLRLKRHPSQQDARITGEFQRIALRTRVFGTSGGRLPADQLRKTLFGCPG
jgi:tetratricopeptide (TPR) repeat protein